MPEAGTSSGLISFAPGVALVVECAHETSTDASAPDEVVVFQSYTDLINSERETLWARHNALLLANSIIIGSLALSPAELWENKWAALAMLSAGLLISAAWLGIAVQGWSAMRQHSEIAGNLRS